MVAPIKRLVTDNHSLEAAVPMVALEPVVSVSAGGLLDPTYPRYTKSEFLVWTLQASFLAIATQVM